jgi:hypothetical protein
MGQKVSKSKKDDAIPDELIAFELNGQVLDADYLGKSYLSLKEFVPQAPDELSSIPEYFLPFSSVYTVLKPDFNGLENGYLSDANGIWYLTYQTDLDDITGQMFDWWHRACDSSDKYRWTQPFSHKSCEWESKFYETKISKRTTGNPSS